MTAERAECPGYSRHQFTLRRGTTFVRCPTCRRCGALSPYKLTAREGEMYVWALEHGLVTAEPSCPECGGPISHESNDQPTLDESSVSHVHQRHCTVCKWSAARRVEEATCPS